MDGVESAIYNLGNSKGYSVRDVIKVAQRVTKRDIPAVEEGRRLGDPPVLIANSERIHRELGWKPMYEDLEDIIRTAWIWHQNDCDWKGRK